MRRLFARMTRKEMQQQRDDFQFFRCRRIGKEIGLTLNLVKNYYWIIAKGSIWSVDKRPNHRPLPPFPQIVTPSPLFFGFHVKFNAYRDDYCFWRLGLTWSEGQAMVMRIHDDKAARQLFDNLPDHPNDDAIRNALLDRLQEI